MQDAIVDKKTQILWDKYNDYHYADFAQQDIEQIRNNATYKGMLTTGGLLALNEAARLSFRSRKLNNTTFITLK